MSIITIRCRLVAGIKKNINRKSIKNISVEDRALLQKPLDEKIEIELSKPTVNDPKVKKKIEKTTFVTLCESSEDVC